MLKTSYLIAGLGKTGHSIARYLSRRHQPFVVFDTRIKPQNLGEFLNEFPETPVFLGEIPEQNMASIEAVISSPGVPLDHPSLQKLHALGVPIYGDIDCLAREVTVPVVAITGTNGKSTVTTLVGEMAKASGLVTAVAGNIGEPVLDVLDDGVDYGLWVLELSSFQLELTTAFTPYAATILNISPDHLDRHHYLEAYAAAKQRIYHQAQYAIYNRADSLTFPQAAAFNACSFGLDEPAHGQWGIRLQDKISYLAYGEMCFLSVDAMRLKGTHNWTNALAACALAHALGISFEVMSEVLQRFSGLPHRTQWIRTLDDVTWIDDSKGTNIGATISALIGLGGTLSGKLVLIAGGQGKGADFRELRAAIQNYVSAVILIGEDADKLEAALHDVVPIFRAQSLEQAVKMAQKETNPGDMVLLSPACASLDMFRDYNHRAEVFTAAVNAL